MSSRRRLRRWLGLGGVGVRRTVVRAVRTDRGRLRLSVLGVAIVVALLLVVTGLGVGLTTGSTVADDDVDYWLAPESDGAGSALVSADHPQFGDVHETNDRIRDLDGVEFASPVLSEPLRVEHDGTGEYLLVVGVVDASGFDGVAGVSTDPLRPGDPSHATGEWTGEVVLSAGAADLLAVDEGDELTVAGNDSFAVAGIDDGAASAGVPIAVAQLSEIQTLTGAADHDEADQFAVGATDDAVADELEAVYPRSELLTRSDLAAGPASSSELPLALSLVALVVAVAVGVLFVLTTTALEVVADRRQLATLSAIGFSARSRLSLIGVQTLVVSLLGGVLGTVGGFAGIRLLNAAATATLTSQPIAASRPIFALYGLGAAVLIGLLSLPALFVLVGRVSGGVPQ